MFLELPDPIKIGQEALQNPVVLIVAFLAAVGLAFASEAGKFFAGRVLGTAKSKDDETALSSDAPGMKRAVLFVVPVLLAIVGIVAALQLLQPPAASTSEKQRTTTAGTPPTISEPAQKKIEASTAPPAVAIPPSPPAASPQKQARLPEPVATPAPPPAPPSACSNVTLPIKAAALHTSADRVCAIAACTSMTMDAPSIAALKRWIDTAKAKGGRMCDIADREALGDDALLTRLLAIAATQSTAQRSDDRTSCLDARQALIDEINDINSRLRNGADAASRCGSKAQTAASAEVSGVVDALR